MSEQIPTYRKKKTKNGVYAVVTLPDGVGGRRDVMLGKYGTSASKTEYRRVLVEWEAAGRKLATKDGAPDLTLSELIARYWPWVNSYYRRADGSPTQEVASFLYSLRPLNFLYGPTPVSNFGPIALKSVRQLMIDGYEHPKYGAQEALSRGVVNQRVKRIRRMFRWGVEEELVNATVLHGLQAVRGLQRGRTEARETEPVLPVSRAVVEDTLPLLRPMQADMVRLQLETGMRPGELVAMRACDIDMTGKVWLYRLPTHKTAHHGHARVVPLGPKAQALIRPYLSTDIQAHLFSPARNMEERAATLRQGRKTKVQPSQKDRRRDKPRKKPGSLYHPTTFARAIAVAIKRHNEDKPDAEHIPHWHPHQLRHLRALELKRELGLDAARAVLGHRSPVMTDFYAGLDVATASEAALKMG